MATTSFAAKLGEREGSNVKVLVLGGCGIQGRAAVYDLAHSAAVKEVICADARNAGLGKLANFIDMSRVTMVTMDAADPDNLVPLFQRADVAIDLLPRQLTEKVCTAAIKTRTSVVNSNYAYPITQLDGPAREASITIMPECGLDPGIDLVMYGKAGKQFDELHVINSYCGGLPEAAACDNPLKYKVSWTWEGVLSSSKRDARAIKNGRAVVIPADAQHEADLIHLVEVPGLGQLEAIPNGDAVRFTDLLGVTATIKTSGRYSLRWPGWSAFWKPLKQFGFLSEKPLSGLPCEVTPYQFIDKLMGPQLQYRDDEKDLAVIVNIFEGISKGKKMRLTSRLLIERDLDTGLMAMSKGVGFPASIAAQMIAAGEIAEKGVLSPVIHMPHETFFDRLAERGIVVDEEVEALD